MAFENLTNKFTEAFKKLTSKGKLSESDIKEMRLDQQKIFEFTKREKV